LKTIRIIYQKMAKAVKARRNEITAEKNARKEAKAAGK
jgi:hypothetical protein